ncbi:carboxypeptidase inhibitor SmCI-like [Ruditapes philippinarum]|uniref:carboxypeptidase inhibitor SmCI-like n=1 Tax=Ruditapes philippinarum TaxID=129788 RepID=UPI00295A7FA9|nr:carboxypeptidase inhibitor SmCI-like [Ruditapes philippinarum]
MAVKTLTRGICKLQADVGPCGQYIKKWHYNSFSQDCEEFTYGGCLGNGNICESKDQCMMYFDSSRWYNRERVTTERPDETIKESSGEIAVATDVESVCLIRCVSYGESYWTVPCIYQSRYYDYLNGECKQFIYGGCDTNGNKFDTQEACEARCSPRQICLQQKQVCNCMASMRRFYFDYSAQESREFVNGGCDGNANSFETKEACERRCDSLVTDRNIPGRKLYYN